ncbi:Glutamine amidotransferase class 1 domain containing 3 [Balamuthia mandrillaris]
MLGRSPLLRAAGGVGRLHHQLPRSTLGSPFFAAGPFRFYATEEAEAEGSKGRKRVAVVLSGCGVQDGTEITEAVSVLLHLSRHGAETTCYAPNISFNAFNHGDDHLTHELRNVLDEAARISRGQIRNLHRLLGEEQDAVIFPGGFGAAKNLCSFAKDGSNMTVQGDVEDVLKEFHSAQKPIGLCCIAPVLAAKVIPGVRVTLGRGNKNVNEAIAQMGGEAVEKNVDEVLVDEKNKVVTTPAYMFGDATPYEVFEGIGKMVDEVLRLVNKQ